MAEKKWKLMDISEGIYLDRLDLGDSDLGKAARGCSVTKRTRRGGLCDGVDTIEIDNGTCKFTVLPTRGMGIWRADADGLQIGWNSPIKGPVHPKFVPLMEPSGLGWVDGFDELLVRCGLESNGAPDFDENGKLTYPLHGRIANRPAHYVEVTVDDKTGEITLYGEVDETRFHFLKLRLSATIRIRPAERGFRIFDRIENLSESPAEAQMLYHTNYGPPLLDAGAQVVAAVKTVVPRDVHAAEGMPNWNSYDAPKPGFKEQVYFFELAADADDHTQVLLKNAHGLQGVSMHFMTSQLPCFTVWKNTTALSDGYVTGLEPGTNFPNPRTFEGRHGRFVALPPRGSTSFQLRLEAHNTSDQIEQAEKAIEKLQSGIVPNVLEESRENWSGGPLEL